MMSEATSSGDVVAVIFLIAEKYINALQTLAQSLNQKAVIVPIELASLAGMPGGLGRIAASAIGGPMSREPRRALFGQERALRFPIYPPLRRLSDRRGPGWSSG